MTDAHAPWSGALAPRKKGDLLVLGKELGLQIDDGQTKNEILDVLKSYIDANEGTLGEDPRFKGLYGRKTNARKTSVAPNGDDSEESAATAVSNIASAIKKKIAPKPTRHIGSPERAALARAGDTSVVATPSRIPLPPSPSKLLSELIVRVRPEVEGAVEKYNKTAAQVGHEKDKALANTKSYLSSSANIATLTILFELFTLLYSFIEWQSYSVAVTPPGTKSSYTVVGYYPPLKTFTDQEFYATVLEWTVPTLLIPLLAGYFISPTGRADLDPVSAGIARLVAVLASNWGVSTDLLAKETRILSASTALAYSVAESIVGGGSTPSPSKSTALVRRGRA